MAIDGADALKGFTLNQPIYMMHTRTNGGRLPDDIRAHACWHYARLAHKHLQSVAEGAVYEGEKDTTESLNNIARAVCLQYRLDSPDEFLKFMGYVKTEVKRVNGTWNAAIEQPFKGTYIKVAN